MTGQQCRAGSMRLCPPIVAKLPATKAASAQPYQVVSSPNESSKNTDWSPLGHSCLDRRQYPWPRCSMSFATSSKRSG